MLARCMDTIRHHNQSCLREDMHLRWDVMAFTTKTSRVSTQLQQ